MITRLHMHNIIVQLQLTTQHHNKEMTAILLVKYLSTFSLYKKNYNEFEQQRIQLFQKRDFFILLLHQTITSINLQIYKLHYLRRLIQASNKSLHVQWCCFLDTLTAPTEHCSQFTMVQAKCTLAKLVGQMVTRG